MYGTEIISLIPFFKGMVWLKMSGIIPPTLHLEFSFIYSNCVCMKFKINYLGNGNLDFDCFCLNLLFWHSYRSIEASPKSLAVHSTLPALHSLTVNLSISAIQRKEKKKHFMRSFISNGNIKLKGILFQSLRFLIESMITVLPFGVSTLALINWTH